MTVLRRRGAVPQPGQSKEPRPDRTLLLERILDAAGEGIVLAGSLGEVLFANAAARSILGMQDGTSSSAVRALGLGGIVARVAGSGKPVWEDRELHLPARRVLSVRAEPFEDGAIVLINDVTNARHSEQVRSDFVANVSHELKTPVSAIILLAEQLGHAVKEDPEAARSFSERIGQEAERLAALVVDLLDLSRAESTLPLPLQHLSAAQAAADAVTRVAALAEARGIRVSVSDRSDDATFEADSTLVGAALANLLDNAVRYSPEGSSVRLTIAAGPGEVSFSVTDEGPGIPSLELPRIFERFYRVDKARARATGGTGLGLAVVKHAAERHGGKVSAESVVGHGSTFTLTFPVQVDE